MLAHRYDLPSDHLTDERPSLEYVAGFFDAEGCAFGKAYRTRSGCRNDQVCIVFCNTNLPVLEKIADTLGRGRIRVQPTGRYRPLYRLEVRKQEEIFDVAARLLPFTIIKSDDLRRLVDFIHQMPEYRSDRIELPKETLLRLHHVERLSSAKMASILGIGRDTVLSRMADYGIPRMNYGRFLPRHNSVELPLPA